MKKGIFYYLTVGFKLALVSIIPNAILLIPKIMALLNPIWYLITIPSAMILNGYFIIKFKNFIFK